MNIGIFGASSHIAKGLIHHFGNQENLVLFKRGDYGKLAKAELDVIINCVGVGTNPEDYTKYFVITEKYDNLAINYLHKHPDALYISLSSGAVYGDKSIIPENYYGIARLYAEAKHRSFKDLNIVDLRLFSYFSRFINLDDDYFMANLIKAILNKEVLLTSRLNIIRDFVHPEDLFPLVKEAIKMRRINRALEVYSAAPVSKREILDYFSSKYGLEYTSTFSEGRSATGVKGVYCPARYGIRATVWQPKYTSMETIKMEAKYLLK